MVLATSTRSNVVGNNVSSVNNRLNGTSEGNARLDYEGDDEDMISSSNGERVQGSVFSIYGVDPRRDKHLRYRTRVFAAECLSYLPTAVGTDPAHFDLALARTQAANGRTSSGDWLVLHLQELVSLSYQISTGQFEGMQPIGVRLLSIIMDKFEKTPDPELPGHLLVEQYQAQLVSAVRSAITSSTGPLLLEAGLQLATKILTSSIIAGDRVALNRMFSLISRPLNDIKDLYYPSFAEWIACKIKVRLLSAHASIKCYVYQFLREQKVIPDEYLQLTPLFSSSSAILGKYWISVLKDYSYICFGLHSKFSYIPFLDGIQSPLVSSKVKKCLDEAWPPILQATVFDAVPVKFDLEKSSDNIVEDLPKTSFLSGYSMVRLELAEFQFLWGLALLIMLQEHQVEVGRQVKTLLAHRKMKRSGDLMIQETDGWMSCEIALPIFESLSKEVYFSHKFLTYDICKELLQVLTYTEHLAGSWNGLVISLLSQVVQFCPDDFFEKEDFTTVATELCLKHLFITFQSDDASSQDCPSRRDLVSELSIAVETILCRMNHKLNQSKLKLALISICHEWFRGASTNLSLSKVIVFLRNVARSVKNCFIDEAEPVDDPIHVNKILGAWMSLLAFLSQDCIRRLHIVENKMCDSSKVLVKILAFCLEEAVAVARLRHETRNFGQNKDNQMPLFTLFKNCIKCIRDTFYDSNIQVQTVGLHVLKSTAQRDLAEGSHVKGRSFSLFFAGELFGDIFLLIQHTLKEHISRESIIVTEECLRLLFLFHTLSQASECLRAVTMLLLEALLMVFAVSADKHSPEVNEIKATARKLVSHLVQTPSSAIQIKDAMLSMAVTRRQQFQDMIRASVTQGQTTMQIKLNVQAEPNAKEDHQLHASDFTVPSADKYDIEKENDDDDEDWDSFQSFPAKETSPSTSDSHVGRFGSDNASVGEASTVESDHPHKNYPHYHNLPHPKISVEVGEAQNPVTYTGKALTGKNELEEPSDPQHPMDDDRERTSECKSDADHTIGLFTASEDVELMKEQCRGVHGEVTIRREGDEDGSRRQTDDELADPKDDLEEGGDQHPHHEGGSELRTEGDDDGPHENSVLAAPEDNAESDERSLQHEGDGELTTEGDGDGSHEHYDEVLSAPKGNEWETEDQLHIEGGGELRSEDEDEGYQNPSGDTPEAPKDPMKDSGSQRPDCVDKEATEST